MPYSGTIDYGPGGPALVPQVGPSSYPTISSDGGVQAGNDLNNQLSSYTVQPGDNLSAIAAQFGIPWQQIYSANQGVIGGNPNLIQPNQVLQIPGGGGQTNTSLTGTMTGMTVNPSGGSQTIPTTPSAPQTPIAPTGTPVTPQSTLSTIPQFAYTPEQQQYLANINTQQQQLQGLVSMVDTNFNQELSEINAQMENLKVKQGQENEAYSNGIRQAGLNGGFSQFTPEIMHANVKAAVDAGISKIREITLDQHKLIREAKDANLTRKLDILKEVRSLDKEKYEAAQQMKKDFYVLQEEQDTLVKRKIGEALPSIYTELANTPETQRQGLLAKYAQQLGVPVSTFASQYREYDKKEQEPIQNLRTKLMEIANDVPWSLSDLQGSPADFAKKLLSSKTYQAYRLHQSLENRILSAQASKAEAEAQALKDEGTIPSNVPNNVAQVAATILGSGRFTKLQKADLLAALKTGNTETIKRVAFNNARSLMDATTSQNTLGNQNAVKNIKYLGNLFNQYYANGGKSSLLKGTVEEVAGKLGKVNDPKLRNIATQIKTNLLKYRKEVTGVAYGIKEGQEIASLFPSTTNGQALNNAIIAGRLSATEEQVRNAYDSVLGDGVYDSLISATIPVATPQQQTVLQALYSNLYGQ